MGSSAVPEASMRDPRVMIRASCCDPRISAPDSITSVTDASLPELPSAASPLPM